MNSLISASSPYLQLFAESSVDWFEYDDALLKRAREERKPLHVSIGSLHSTRTPLEQRFYARDVVGETLNEAFINVKIDKDERPDLERLFTVYVSPESRRMQSGRVELYPTTVFLEPRMLTLTQPQCLFSFDPYDDFNVRWRTMSNDILQAHLVGGTLEAGAGTKLLSEMHRQGLLELEEEPLTRYETLLQDCQVIRDQLIDMEQVLANNLYAQIVAARLIRLWYFSTKPRSREDTKGLDVALITLTQWVRGISYDHVEGGFYAPMYTGVRESGADLTKTLATNGWALQLLMSAVAISRDSLLTEAAQETADFIVERLHLAAGGFAASQYEPTNSTRLAWDRRTVRRVLTEDEMLVIETLYGLDKRANWHGRWLLRRTGAWRNVASQFFFSKEEADDLLASGRAKLRDLAKSREPSYETDQRLLVANNALSISALLNAGQILDEPRWMKAALAALSRLHQEFSGLGESKGVPAEGETLTDCTLLLRATIDALTVDWIDAYVDLAKRLVEWIKRHYLRDGRLVLSRKDPSGWLLTMPQSPDLGRVSPIDAVRRGLHLYAVLFQDPEVFGMLQRLFVQVEGIVRAIELRVYDEEVFALDFRHGETVVVLTGPEQECKSWQQSLAASYHPTEHVFYVPFSNMREAPSFLPRMMSVEDRNRVTAYVVHDRNDFEPRHEIEDVADLLTELQAGPIGV